MERNDRILEAQKHYFIFRSAPEVLMTKFNLSIQDATNIIWEGQKIIREQHFKEYNPEDEIKGMDYKYDPEKCIRHINITY